MYEKYKDSYKSMYIWMDDKNISECKDNYNNNIYYIYPDDDNYIIHTTGKNFLKNCNILCTENNLLNNSSEITESIYKFNIIKNSSTEIIYSFKYKDNDSIDKDSTNKFIYILNSYNNISKSSKLYLPSLSNNQNE